MYTPWGEAARTQTPIFIADLTTQSGVTDGTRVWLHHELTRVELTCALAHELDHIKSGHAGHQSPEVERGVRERVAKRLLPFSRLIDLAGSQEPLWVLAEGLSVTQTVLEDRFSCLTLGERRLLGCALIA